MFPRNTFAITFLATLCAAAPPLRANAVLDPTAPAGLTLFNLGNIPNVDTQFGGYSGLAFDGSNLLLSVGNAATANQTIWSLPLGRINGHVVGFGPATPFAQVLGYPASCTTCFGNVMAGGLVLTGGGLMYTTLANSFLGQYTGGSSTLLDLASTGALTGGLNYVPGSFTGKGAGQLKVSSTDASGRWYTLNLGGTLGSYSLNSYTGYNIGVEAFSFDYVPADATFHEASIVLGDATHQRLDIYGLDANGNPCNTAGCSPVIHLVTGTVQIGLGVVRDPVSGDILFTTSDNEIWVLSDTDVGVPEPSTFALALAGAMLLIRFRLRQS